MTEKYMGIDIDYSKDQLFDTLGLLRLKESYMREDETSPQQRFAFVSKQFGSNPEHAQRLYDYASKHWLSYSTPILSFGRSKKGLPISCFLTYLEDTAEGLVDTLSETNWLSMLGGGVGIHFRIRGADEKSTGVMPHMKIYDSSSLAFRQGKTRRGSYAAYLDISHPDIIPFIEMRKPTGDQNLKALNLHHGINIPDKFMEIIERCMIDPNANDDWDLICPNTGKVVEVVSAKYLWQLILETRMQTGEPYLFFIDTANRALPEEQKKLGLKIHGSNLCVTGDTMISVEDDFNLYDIDIKTFVENIGNFKNPKVLSQNIKTGKMEYKPIEAAGLTGKEREVIEITDDISGKTLKCTPDHKIFTKNRGYVEAQYLEETDELVIFE